VTQIANGLSTTTFTYDNNGNVTQKTIDGTTTTYVYDYANRLTALGVLGATTTYAYDWAGNRVSQTGTSTTFIYPFKWYSVASSTGTGAKYATTTDYVFNGESLVGTIDQQTASGNATGTAKTRYIHPDHLGSTNVVTDENDNVVQTLDYYPYGATRISSATSTRERRQYIGQFTDDSSLSYLNARFYDSGRGQFTSEDPAFLAVGSRNQLAQFSRQEQQQFLADPQQTNAYGYARDNPIARKDPDGNSPFILVLAIGGAFVGTYDQLEYDLASGQTSSVPQYVASGLKGAGVGGVAGEAVINPLTIGAGVLRVYGAYETLINSYNFASQVLVNGSNYNMQQKLQTTDTLYRDLGTRVISSAIPREYRIIYDTLRSIYDSLELLNSQQGQIQSGSSSSGKTSNNGGGSAGGQSSGSSNNGGWGSTNTACGKLCS
jgi:RHS repeat-associated protein